MIPLIIFSVVLLVQLLPRSEEYLCHSVFLVCSHRSLVCPRTSCPFVELCEYYFHCQPMLPVSCHYPQDHHLLRHRIGCQRPVITHRIIISWGIEGGFLCDQCHLSMVWCLVWRDEALLSVFLAFYAPPLSCPISSGFSRRSLCFAKFLMFLNLANVSP